ncbi:MAG: hypothetical protein NZ901_09460 [Geminocystis sp.]|nr:hypothetical protein [Geminocystis sp.]MDW8116010.1 hypothetical protein [Geminocystis sp.]
MATPTLFYPPAGKLISCSRLLLLLFSGILALFSLATTSRQLDTLSNPKMSENIIGYGNINSCFNPRWVNQPFISVSGYPPNYPPHH